MCDFANIMTGEGSVLLIHDADSPPNLDILDSMNFPDKSVNECVRHLNWVTIEEDFEMRGLENYSDVGTN